MIKPMITSFFKFFEKLSNEGNCEKFSDSRIRSQEGRKPKVSSEILIPTSLSLRQLFIRGQSLPPIRCTATRQPILCDAALGPFPLPNSLRAVRLMSVDTFNIPLFPLGTVLFPGGPLPLRIFEPRYLDMVSDRMKQQSPFGVCLIRSGSEGGAPAELYRIGTLATIVDWNQLPDGLPVAEEGWQSRLG